MLKLPTVRSKKVLSIYTLLASLQRTNMQTSTGNEINKSYKRILEKINM